MPTASRQRQVQHLHVLLLRAVQLALDRRAVGGEEEIAAPSRSSRRRIDLGQQLERPAAQSGLLDQLAPGRSPRAARPRRRACRPGSRDASGRTAAGTGARAPPIGLPVGVEQQRHHADRARRAHDVALERARRRAPRTSADGDVARRSPGGPAGRRGGGSRPSDVAPLDACDMRRRRARHGAASAPRQREGGADQLAEQRVRPVGAALELGVGLRADPERVVGELDELDQPPVGRRAAAAQPGRLEARPGSWR